MRWAAGPRSRTRVENCKLALKRRARAAEPNRMQPSDASPTGEVGPGNESGGVGLFDEVLVDLLGRRYLVLDARGRVSRWSSEAERMLGWREEEVSGRCAIAPPLTWGGEGLAAW